MKKFLHTYLIIFVVVSFTTTFNEVLAAKKSNNQPAQSIKVTNEQGEETLYASALDPKEDNIFIPLNLILSSLKKGDLSNVSVILSNIYNSTTKYDVPKDAVSVQKKKIKNKVDKYLTVNLFDLRTPEGVKVPPSALQSSNYRLRFVGKATDTSTESFNIQIPALIFGKVEGGKKAGSVTVENLAGDIISSSVAINPDDGTFVTEVRANKLSLLVKSRKALKAQTSEGSPDETNNNNEEIAIGLLHAVTGVEEGFAITPLDPKQNAEIAENPILINKSSSLIANLGKGDEDLAVKVAKEELENIKEGKGDLNSQDLKCDIDQFADQCDLNDNNALTLLGKTVKDFVSGPTCNLPEEIKSTILESPDLETAQGYCKFVQREVDENTICENYSKTLKDFKASLIKKLPCPPIGFCGNRFKNIKPPICTVLGTSFCSTREASPQFQIKSFALAQVCRGPRCETPTTNSCINKPVKNPFCGRIGVDLTDLECLGLNEERNSPTTWEIASSSKGNEYCVSSRLESPDSSIFTSADIAEKICEVNECHKGCEAKFGSSKITGTSVNANIDCNFTCDAEAGRINDCGNPKSKYFSNKCCQGNISAPPLFGQINPGSVGFGIGTGPIKPNLYTCLCSDQKNFNEKGYVIPESQKKCSVCPEGYEADGDYCSPLCKEGLVKVNGVCKTKCPEGFIDDGSGSCKCPEGKALNYTSRKCETISSNCPDYCKNYFNDSGSSYTPPSGSGYTSSGTTNSSIPPECKSCFGVVVASCGNSNMLPNNVPGEAQCICPQGLPYFNNGSCVASCPNGNPPASASANLPPRSPIPCTNSGKVCTANETPSTGCICASGATYNGANVPCSCPGNSTTYTAVGCGGTSNCPAPYIMDSAFPNQCTCPSSIPYELGANCVISCPAGLTPTTTPGTAYSSTRQSCKCSDGSYPNSQGTCSTTSQDYCSPSVTVGPTGCTCNPAGGGYKDNATGYCTCPSGSSQTYTAATGCNNTSSSNYCSPGITIGTAGCTCNPSAGSYNSNGYCTCPTNSGPYTKESGCTSTLRPCTANEGPSNGCYCFGNGYTGTDGKCQCSGGVQYTGGGCVTTSTNYCSPSVVPTTSNQCTCNPSGGSYFSSNNICTCPSGSSSQTYTAATGCSSYTSSCSSPYIVNPAYNSSNPQGVAPCTCPDGKYYYNNECVTTCPSPLVTGTPPSGGGAGPIPSCLCPGTSQTPGQNGQCASASITFTSAEISGSNLVTKFTSTNLGSGCPYLYNSAGTNIYSLCGAEGARTENITLSVLTSNNISVMAGDILKLCQSNNPSNCSNTVTVTNTVLRTCGAGEGPNISSSNPCTCQSLGGTTIDSNGYCKCPSSAISYTAIGCRVCPINEVYSSSNPCQCAGTATYDINNKCYCPTGSGGGTYSESGCTPPVITLSSATISSGNVTISYSIDSNACLLVKDVSNNTLKSANLCGVGSFSSVFPTSDFTPALVSGTQVKLCNQNNSSNCSSLVTVP